MKFELLLMAAGVIAAVTGQNPTQIGGNPIGQSGSDASVTVLGPSIGAIGGQQGGGSGQYTSSESLNQTQQISINSNVNQQDPIEQGQSQEAQALVQTPQPIILTYPYSPPINNFVPSYESPPPSSFYPIPYY